MVAVAEPVELGVVRDVARGLLEVGGEPRALQDLREQVRRPLARDVRPAQLRDRVVAVAEEDRLVELRGALALPQLDDGHLGQGVGELVEEQTAQRAGVARVAGEQRALDRLRQVDEREDRPVEVREVGSEPRLLLLGVLLERVCHRLHRGQGIAHSKPRIGRHLRLVVSELAARLLPGRARSVRLPRLLRRALLDGRAEHDRLPAAGRGAVPALGRAGARRVRVRPEAPGRAARASSPSSTGACGTSATGSGRCGSRSSRSATRGSLELLLGSLDPSLRLAFDLEHPSWDGIEPRLAEAGAVRVGDLDHPAPFRYLRRREAPDEAFAAAVRRGARSPSTSTSATTTSRPRPPMPRGCASCSSVALGGRPAAPRRASRRRSRRARVVRPGGPRVRRRGLERAADRAAELGALRRRREEAGEKLPHRRGAVLVPRRRSGSPSPRSPRAAPRAARSRSARSCPDR